MDWATRLRIATGSAKGLAYLHEDCKSQTTLVSSLFDHMDRDLSCSSILEILKCIAGHPKIIHRDIKSANILLDNNYEAMVTLSQLISEMINVVVNEIITHAKIKN